MPLVSVSVGATVQIGDRISGRDFFKANLEINDIDTSLDIKEQMDEATAVIKSTFNYLYEKLDSEIEKRLEVSIK